jgi:hypothetical protein
VHRTDALTRRATDITRANFVLLDGVFARLKIDAASDFCERLLAQTGVLLPSTRRSLLRQPQCPDWLRPQQSVADPADHG